jgi:hypothetical protein
MHMLRELHCYGKMEEIMDKIDHAKKGRIMNIKELSHAHMRTHTHTHTHTHTQSEAD